MNKKTGVSIGRSCGVSLLALFLAASVSQAAISITNFNLTTTSFSFDIAGTLPETPPATSPSILYFVNPDVAADPGYALSSGIVAISYEFSGSQPLLEIRNGNSAYGDFSGVYFLNDFAAGESISGTVSATWSITAFDPSQVTSLDVYWGYNDALPADPATQPSAITGGTYLTTVSTVPEPSAVLLIGAGALVLGCRRAAGRVSTPASQARP